MALNSSGPLSFGGSTVGQSINLELGVSATALASIDSAAFRGLAGVASGQISLSSFYGKSNAYYYMQTFKSATDNLSFSTVASDTSGNLYLGGSNSTTSVGWLVKVNSATAAVSYQRYATNSSPNFLNSIQRIAVTSANNVYANGSSGFGTRDVMGSYWNTSGVIQWSRYVNSGLEYFTPDSKSNGVSLDSSSNVYFAARRWRDSAGQTSAGIVKFNTSGTLLSQYKLNFNFTNTSLEMIGRTLSVRQSNGNIYIGCDYNDYTGVPVAFRHRGVLCKLDSSFAVQWTRSIYNNVSGVYNGLNIQGMVLDSSENIYLAGLEDYTSQLTLAKYNSSGTFQWCVLLNHTGRNWIAATVDSSDNIYVCGEPSSSTVGPVIAKYNSSGTLQWQRAITVTISAVAQTISFSNIIVNSSGVLILSGQVANTNVGGKTRAWSMVYPTSGSITGTFTLDGAVYTIAASSYTASSLTLSSASDPMNIADPGASSTSSGIGSAASTETASNLQIT